MNTYSEFKKTMKYCENTFGVPSSHEDSFFHCPECDEPLLYEDWDTQENWEELHEEFEISGTAPWKFCPVCGFQFYM